MIPAARWDAARQHGVGLVPGLIAMLPHAPVIAKGSGTGVSGEVRSVNDAFPAKAGSRTLLETFLSRILPTRYVTNPPMGFSQLTASS